MKRIIQSGDRVRGMCGEEGGVISVNDRDGEAKILLDQGGERVELWGYWEIIPSERLNP